MASASVKFSAEWFEATTQGQAMVAEACRIKIPSTPEDLAWIYSFRGTGKPFEDYTSDVDVDAADYESVP